MFRNRISGMQDTGMWGHEDSQSLSLFDSVWVMDTLLSQQLQQHPFSMTRAARVFERHEKQVPGNLLFTKFACHGCKCYYPIFLQNSISVSAMSCCIMPLHTTNHWSVLVFDISSHTVSYWDSLAGRTKSSVLQVNFIVASVGNAAAQFVTQDIVAKMASTFKELKVTSPAAKWTINNVGTRCPQQDNGLDCGVFLLGTVEALYHGLEPSFTQVFHCNCNAFPPLIGSWHQADIPLMRKRIALRICGGHGV